MKYIIPRIAISEKITMREAYAVFTHLPFLRRYRATNLYKMKASARQVCGSLGPRRNRTEGDGEPWGGNPTFSGEGDEGYVR